jgi:hypothetical protein
MSSTILNYGLLATATTESIQITGRTFDSKDRLKALGAKWKADTKAWVLPLGTDLTSLLPPPPPPISASMRQQMTDYFISDSYLRRVSGRSRHGRCCSEAKTKLDDFNPQGPMWYICKTHGDYKSNYDGT